MSFEMMMIAVIACCVVGAYFLGRRMSRIAIAKEMSR